MRPAEITFYCYIIYKYMTKKKKSAISINDLVGRFQTLLLNRHSFHSQNGANKGWNTLHDFCPGFFFPICFLEETTLVARSQSTYNSQSDLIGY